MLTNTELPVIEPWNSDPDNVPLAKARENAFVESDNGDPSKSRATTEPTQLTNATKRKSVANNDFYHDPFVFKESDRDVRNLVASSFTTRIRDYDMPDDIKVLTNLYTYDDVSISRYAEQRHSGTITSHLEALMASTN
ncbi:hypothetical protein Tco_1550053 [Tanacetum coccineum]